MATEKRQAHALRLLQQVMPPVVLQWKRRRRVRMQRAAIQAAQAHLRPSAADVKHASVLFVDFPSYVVDKILAALVPYPVVEGEVIIPFGVSSHDVFYVAHGAVRVDYPKKVNRAAGSRKVGSVFGELALLLDGVQPLRYKAVTTSFLWRLPGAAYADALKALPPRVRDEVAAAAQQQQAASGLTSLDPLAPKDLKYAAPHLFKPVDDDTLALLISHAEAHPVPEGTALATCGAITTALLLLTKGEAVVEGAAPGYRHGDTKPLPLGTWIGYELLTPCRVHTRTVTARTPCGCWRIPKEAVIEVLTSPRPAYAPHQFLAIRAVATDHLLRTAVGLTPGLLAQVTAGVWGVSAKAWRGAGMPRVRTRVFARGERVLSTGETAQGCLLIASTGRVSVSTAAGAIVKTMEAHEVLNPVEGLLDAPSRITLAVESPYAIVWSVPFAALRQAHPEAHEAALAAAAKAFAATEGADTAARLQRAVLAAPAAGAALSPRRGSVAGLARAQQSIHTTSSSYSASNARPPPLSRTGSMASTQVSYESWANRDGREGDAAQTPSLQVTSSNLSSVAAARLGSVAFRVPPPQPLALAERPPPKDARCDTPSAASTASTSSPRGAVVLATSLLPVSLMSPPSSALADLTTPTSVYFARALQSDSPSDALPIDVSRRRGGIVAATMPSPFPVKGSGVADRERRLQPAPGSTCRAHNAGWLAGPVLDVFDVPAPDLVGEMETEALRRIVSRRVDKARKDHAPAVERVLEWGGEWALPDATLPDEDAPPPAWTVPSRHAAADDGEKPLDTRTMLPPVGCVQAALLQQILGGSSFVDVEQGGALHRPAGCTREEPSQPSNPVLTAPSPAPPSRRESLVTEAGGTGGAAGVLGDMRDARTMQLVFPAPGFLYDEDRAAGASPSAPSSNADAAVWADHAADEPVPDAGRQLGANDAAATHFPAVAAIRGAISANAAVGFEGEGRGAAHTYPQAPRLKTTRAPRRRMLPHVFDASEASADDDCGSRTSTTLSVGLVTAQPYGPVLEDGSLALPMLSAVFERQEAEKQARRRKAFVKAHRPVKPKPPAAPRPVPRPNDDLWGRLTSTPVQDARPRRARRRKQIPAVLEAFLQPVPIGPSKHMFHA
eukprot:TRINITY_DN18081_c0_g1_i1.p1 TRINITY_DN18081_c0_g1~~TRINITY_DN18081_c0_g1_i1.p1  ORF type:complete len:1225 (+),score=273.70 TRINITY_DN18081_c0_g1_i1:302-3676(+)